MTGRREKYLLEGRNLDREALLTFCQEGHMDPDIPGWKKEVLRFILEFTGGREDPILQESSGTTGPPKQVLLDRSAMVSSARKTLARFGLQRGDPVLLCLPVRYIAGKMMVVRALVGGLDLYLVEPDSRPFRNARREYAFVPLVPLQLYESLHHRDDIRRAGKILVGGAETGPAVRKRLLQISNPEVYESFGMTETYSHFALRRISGPAPDPLFRPMDGVELRTDKRGCLIVDIPGITRGPVVTRDMVEIDRESGGFRWMGRVDNLISTGGIKVNPEQLEERIGSLLGTGCVVVAVPDEKLGMKLILVAESPDQRDVERWRTLLKDHLAAYEIPRRLITVRELPRNASFKPDRSAIRRMVRRLPGP